MKRLRYGQKLPAPAVAGSLLMRIFGRGPRASVVAGWPDGAYLPRVPRCRVCETNPAGSMGRPCRWCRGLIRVARLSA